MADQEAAGNIEDWNIRRLIQALEAAGGNETDKISLIVPPSDEISRVANMLRDEYEAASNYNRQSEMASITSVQNRLSTYNEVPPNGLGIYAGTILTADNEEKKVTIDFEPYRAINASLYVCDNRFHVEALNELLE